MKFKILFGCLNMDNFPQTDDEILKSDKSGRVWGQDK